MQKKLYLAFVLILLLSSPLAMAWIVPDTHDWIAKEGLKQAPNSPIGQIVADNFEDFSACMSLTDYSVYFYFQQGFSTIGKVYLGSHNNLICQRAMELADKNNPAEVSCSAGVCGMELMDSPSHNGFVPIVIERSGLVNGIIHAPAEQCVNKEISTPQLNAEGRSALVNKYPVHKAFLVKVFQSDERAGSIDVSNMMDAFVSEVAQNDQYTVGFRGFTAIPTSIHLILALLFLASLTSLALLIRKRDRGMFNKISILLLLIPIIIIILLYVLYFTGNIWKVFQVTTNTLICPILPISGYETYLNKAVSNMVNFYNNGASVVYQIPDPSGLQSLHDADAKNTWKFYLIIFFLILLVSLFIYLNFRRKK